MGAAQRGTSGRSPEGEAGSDELRCCGGLMARVVADGLELRCRRCKQATVVSVATLERAVARRRGRTGGPVGK